MPVVLVGYGYTDNKNIYNDADLVINNFSQLTELIEQELYMTISFNDKVAIVTGAGGGLGRCHALEFAKRGAKVVVNDLGGSVDGTGGSSEAADKVVDEIKAMGGEAISNGSSVTDKAGVKKLVDDLSLIHI